MRKIYSLLAVALMATSYLPAQTGSFKMFGEVSENEVGFLASSPNGEYACGYANGYAMYYNAAENSTLCFGEVNTGGLAYILSAVNDQGVAVGAVTTVPGDITGTIPAYYENGEWKKLPLPKGYSMGGLMDISADGSLMVGWALEGMLTVPCLWKNGEPTVLKFPKLDVYGVEAMGSMADHITADGKMVTGRYAMSTGRWVPAIWKNLDEECELPFLDVMFHLDNPVPGNEPLQSDYITVDVEDPLYYEQYLAWEKEWLAYRDKMAEFETGDRLDGRHSLSPNGKYMCTYMIKGDFTDLPVRIDIEQGTMKVLEELGSGIALSVTNDGNMTVGEPVVSAIRSGYVYLSKADKLVAMEEWIQDEFGYDMIHGENGIASISGEFEQSASWVMNQDGSRMYGYIGGLPYLTYNFRIDLPLSLDVLKIAPAQVKEQEFVYVNGELQFDGEVDHISICNLSGAVLYGAGHVGKTVQLNLPKGVYLVKVISQGTSSIGKIMVK